MALIIDSPRQIVGQDVRRCPHCFLYIEATKCETCPVCKQLICYKCGYCKCDLSIQRAVRIWADSEDEWA